MTDDGLPRIARRRSAISGWGVYAAQPITQDTRIIEYKGELVPQAEASRRESRYLPRQRIWIFWRRVLHTCHHRTQVQTWLRLAGKHVPAIYGPSGDVKSSGDDPTYSVEAASRAAKGT